MFVGLFERSIEGSLLWEKELCIVFDTQMSVSIVPNGSKNISTMFSNVSLPSALVYECQRYVIPPFRPVVFGLRVNVSRPTWRQATFIVKGPFSI